MDKFGVIGSLFGVPRALIGVIHLQALPGTPAITGDVDIVETAKAAEFFKVDGVIVSGVATGQPAEPDEVASVGRRRLSGDDGGLRSYHGEHLQLS